MRRYPIGCFLCLLVVTGISQSATAQIRIPNKGVAYTETPTDDPNFSLMGEFVGEIVAEANENRVVGLQLRSLGGNEFDAMTFYGGLPGQETHQPGPIRMIGRRSEGFVVLSGGPWAVIVQKDGCLLINREGAMIGKLKRIERSSPTIGALPPEGATVLFDGSNVEQFTRGQMTDDGLLMEGADLKPMFQDFNLHVEFRLPYMPEARAQSRGNSGVYLQSRYECQILDSFGEDILVNGAGALYRLRKPDVNACLPPLVWQTYDIQFTAPRWAADGTKVRNAHITSWLNGIKVQDNVALPNKTGAGKPEEPLLLPTKLQDHGDPVRFRNIWIVDRGLMKGEFPVISTPEEQAAAAKSKLEAEEKARLAAEAEAKKKADEAKKQKAEAEAEAKRLAAEKAEADKKASEDAQGESDSAASNEAGPDTDVVAEVAGENVGR